MNATATEIARKEMIDGFPLYVIDNCLSPAQVEAYYNDCSRLAYRKAEKDFDESEYPIFGYDFDPLSFQEKYPIGQVAKEILDELFPDLEFTLFRSYINMSHYGDVDYPHRDCEVGKGNVTFLYYLNKTWDYRWGGETKFYEQGDPKVLVLPKPGRAAIFWGEVEHTGSIPNRLCKTSRFTLALKYVVENKKGEQLIF